MSDLDRLLSGDLATGVHRWRPTTPPVELAERVAAAGWRPARVEGGRSKADVLAAVGEALALPETYGHNFDALADLLDDLAAPTVLLWQGWGLLAEADPRTFATLVTIFGERGGDPVRPAFELLLVGPGPDGVGLPELG